MGFMKNITFLAIIVLLCVNSGIVFAEDNTGAMQAEVSGENAEQKAVADNGSDSGAQWQWGEVVSVDLPNNTVKLKYLDFDTDTEKVMDLVVDEKTAYENIKSLGELKAQDTASIDYMLGSDGKAVIRNISVEKPEALTVPEEMGQEKSVTEGQAKADEQPNVEQPAVPAQESSQQ